MKTMGFPGYFLIVQDYINAARHELNVSVDRDVGRRPVLQWPIAWALRK